MENENFDPLGQLNVEHILFLHFFIFEQIRLCLVKHIQSVDQHMYRLADGHQIFFQRPLADNLNSVYIHGNVDAVSAEYHVFYDAGLCRADVLIEFSTL